MDKNVFALAI